HHPAVRGHLHAGSLVQGRGLAALREAVRAWRALDGHLVDGGLVPSPWSRQTFPRVLSRLLPRIHAVTETLSVRWLPVTPCGIRGRDAPKDRFNPSAIPCALPTVARQMRASDPPAVQE